MALIPKPYNSGIIETPESQFRNAMIQAGLQPPPFFNLDGNIHRYGDPDNLWYVGFSDNIPAGKAGDWKTGHEVTWCANIGRELSTAEIMAHNIRMAEARKKHDEEKIRKNAVAADTVALIWDKAMDASPDHPYLRRKEIGPNGSKALADGRLAVPLYNKDGDLSTLQYIAADSEKRYHPGGATKGCFNILGEIDNKVYICEGFATGATIYETIGKPVVIAYSAGNLEPVAGIIRDKYPTIEMVIVADNDITGVGRNHADQAASKHGGTVIMPPQEDQDVNDFKLAGGDLSVLLEPVKDPWLVSAMDWSSQPEPLSWLVKGWVPKNSFGMVHGPSGHGKSFFVLDWCLNLSSGTEDWHGHKMKPCPVVYLAGEGHHGLHSRIAAWRVHHKKDPTQMWISKSSTDLNLPGPLSTAISFIRGLESTPGLIVVDTLHRFLSGDENSTVDAKSMLDACALIGREFSCTVLLVHHTGVSEEAQHRARGSSSWKGALDFEISIRPDGDDRMIVQQMKMKDAEEIDPQFFKRTKVEIPGWFDEDGEPVSSLVIEKTEGEPQKKDEKTETESGWIRDAWFDSGCEYIGEKPYISRAALRTYLDVRQGKKEENIKQMMKTDNKRFVGNLIEKQIIIEGGQGFLVVDNLLISSMNMLKNS